ncbi:DUF3298 and DUF4163 domain-containing protein [Tamlana sp. 62-3]|uniref:DUF3298 and DUF4163 domain-containing protein n=1 Tax=Neotamlana sargassicola TaxID=2883125 RepID=A0A9X1L6B6_9FLAO|nr:DUF3298 and DUF4163 domain-containing protein [Tamlana sargassicola]MCB4807409.1 DUF3298 and DUF4163 domain-containing protein [Tamlana sargassicola]
MTKHILPTLIIILITFFSCKKETETIQFRETSFNVENNNLVAINAILAKGNEKITSKINRQINAALINALQVRDTDTKALETVEEGISLFNSTYNSFSEEVKEATPPWETQIDVEVMYQSEALASIAITSYVYEGGAHGLTTIIFKNFDLTTGNLIDNVDLFTDYKSFKKLSETYFDKNIEDKNSLFEPSNFKMPKNIAYSNEGIVLLYNTYEIAPYSTGIIEFLIPYNESQPYLAFNHL